jgi:O-succinylbenzoate-CoA ligase
VDAGRNTLTIASMLERQASRHGGVVALVDEPTGEQWTIAELDAASAAAATALAAAGVGHGDRVGLLSPNHPAMVISYLAVARLGAVLVPLNWRLTEYELSAIGDDAGLVALIAHDELEPAAVVLADGASIPDRRRWWIGDGAATVASAGDALPIARAEDIAIDWPSPSPDDLLYLMYTSGTTGRPKGAMHTHATTLGAAIGAIEAMDYRPGDRYLNAMPLFHVASLAMVNICLRRRCTMVLGRAFDPATTWSTVANYRINAMMAVPAMLQMMADAFDESLDTSSLRVLSTGAAPVPLPLLERYHDLGIDIIQAYGLTESGGAVSVLDAEHAIDRLGSAGTALLTLEMRLVDADGTDVSAGAPGEIVLRGPAMAVGYWRAPEATERSFTSGWFRTGDVGIVDDEGFLTIRDRLTDMIISGGENVYPAEVESVLLDHPDVADVAVIGVSSPRWGESPCAVVVPRGEIDPAELIAWTRERLAAFKTPKIVEFVDTLPRNASGKLLKHELRDRYRKLSTD